VKALRDVATAFSWMTILPAHSYDDAHPVRYLPLVGWVFGLTGLGVAELASIVVSGTSRLCSLGWWLYRCGPQEAGCCTGTVWVTPLTVCGVVTPRNGGSRSCMTAPWGLSAWWRSV